MDMLIAFFLFSLMTFDPMTMTLVAAMMIPCSYCRGGDADGCWRRDGAYFGGGRCCLGLLRHQIELFLHHPSLMSFRCSSWFTSNENSCVFVLY